MYVIPLCGGEETSLEINAASALIIQFYVSFLKTFAIFSPVAVSACVSLRTSLLEFQSLLLQARFPKSIGSRGLNEE